MSDGLPHNHSDIKDMDAFRALLADNEGFGRVSGILSRLGDANRLKIFWLLCHHEECVTNISAIMEMSSPAVSHHLRALKEGGLVKTRREGKEVYYSSANIPETEFLHKMIEDLLEMTCPE